MPKKQVARLRSPTQRAVYFRMDRALFERWRRTYQMGAHLGPVIAKLIEADAGKRESEKMLDTAATVK